MSRYWKTTMCIFIVFFILIPIGYAIQKNIVQTNQIIELEKQNEEQFFTDSVLQQMIEDNEAEIDELREELEIIYYEIYSEDAQMAFIGEFECTAYTAGFESTGKNPGDKWYGITSSGNEVKENYTIASDTTVLPYGTKVRIEGFPYVYEVQDTGSAIKGHKIDIYMPELEDAQSFGRKDLKIWIVNE